MNVYFACSITGGRDFERVYQEIVRALAEAGHLVPTAHLAASDVVTVEAGIDPQEVYGRDIGWIRGCDLLIAEASVPSHGVGYEIGFALGLGKPVLVLYKQGRKLSKMIGGNPDPNLTVRTYATPEEAIAYVENYLNNYKLCL
jgi:2'-deoxynucleoside 5'-phosphate N-hydrolase